MSSESDAITVLLDRARQGSEEARNQLVTGLYEQFRRRAHLRLQQERPGHSLATADLMHEALIRLLKNDEISKAANRNQLYRAFSRAMRQVLIDHARKRNALVHGGGRQREELDDLVEDVRRQSQIDVLALHEGLDDLAEKCPREAKVLEMWYFGGWEMGEIGEALGVSLSSVQRDSRLGRAWLRDYLTRKGCYESST
jgi:RNA polymerase sigma factor (TIGR02999 family)